jgi:uncharacterized protein (TIGR03083 family)
METQQKRQKTQAPPRVSALDHSGAMRLAATEYHRVVSLLETLTREMWSATTDCPGWSVRDMAGHMLGMAQMVATMPELLRQQFASQRRAKRDGGTPLDALTAHQVDKLARLTSGEVVDAMRQVGPKAAKARRRAPGFVRALTMPGQQDVGDQQEAWTLGYLLDVILTRDPFMHRVDITRAIGAPMQAEPAHEGVIVNDIVLEWADRHGAPYELVLTGSAGGRWSRGGGERVELDAFEFCRVVSGRSPATGPLAQQVPF